MDLSYTQEHQNSDSWFLFKMAFFSFLPHTHMHRHTSRGEILKTCHDTSLLKILLERSQKNVNPFPRSWWTWSSPSFLALPPAVPPLAPCAPSTLAGMHQTHPCPRSLPLTYPSSWGWFLLFYMSRLPWHFPGRQL